MAALTFGRLLYLLLTSMKNNKKYIGINQHIPFQVLDHAVYTYLQVRHIDKHEIIKHMLEYTKGMNRAEKAASYASLIISRQSYLLDLWLEKHESNDWLSTSEKQRKTMLLCLLCLTFPISYHLLVSIAPALKAHPFISRKSMNIKIAMLYGDNRTVYVAMDALSQILTGYDILKRLGIGQYTAENNPNITNQFIKELVFLTEIKLSGAKSLLFDDYIHRPWFHYFNILDLNTQNLTLLKLIPSEHNLNYLVANI